MFLTYIDTFIDIDHSDYKAHIILIICEKMHQSQYLVNE